MRRNRKNSIKKERIIMLASSAFVLAALTMTGVYMKEQNVESQDNGYTLDFAALEDSAEDKYQEIAQNNEITKQAEVQIAQNTPSVNESAGIQPEVTEDDLDYMPLEVGSGQVEIPGLTDSKEQLEQPELEEILPAEENVVVQKSLTFSEEKGLLRPISGEVLIPYSMDATVYFPTLDQYKYNPAIIIAAQEGTQVSACAEGKVIDIYEDSKIGKAVVLDLGNGYQATYGQLEDVSIPIDSYAGEGEVIGTVAAPTKYYSVEGSNLYFQLTKDGEAINPENLFR